MMQCLTNFVVFYDDAYSSAALCTAANGISRFATFLFSNLYFFVVIPWKAENS